MLGRSPSAISREIKQGITIDGTFFTVSTEWLMDNPMIYQYVLEKLKDKQSPHIIQMNIKKDIGLSIGKNAIYNFMYRYKLKWAKYLKRKHNG